MKLLIDSCVWAGARAVLADTGHEVVVVADRWSRDPGDEDVLALTYSEGRVLVTLDKDFGELAILRGPMHAGIVRLAGIGPRRSRGVGGARRGAASRRHRHRRAGPSSQHDSRCMERLWQERPAATCMT